MKKSNYFIISILLLIYCCNEKLFAQEKFNCVETNLFLNDTIIESNVIFDYFRQEFDSIVNVVGSVFIMPLDSLSLNGQNKYTIRVIKPNDGYLEVYFKDRLLYKYRLIAGTVEGTGYCYYPFLTNVALQGTFKDGKPHGLVFVLRDNGFVNEVMMFRNGKYVRHIYHWLSFSRKSLRERSKNRSSNPLRNDEPLRV